jgi:hypothetical protein
MHQSLQIENAARLAAHDLRVSQQSAHLPDPNRFLKTKTLGNLPGASAPQGKSVLPPGMSRPPGL